MKKILAQLLMLVIFIGAVPFVGHGADAYPGAMLEGEWLGGMSGRKIFDVQGGKVTSVDMEGNKEEASLEIISDDGQTVVFKDDNFQYSATKQANGSLELVRKGNEKRPMSFKKK